MSRFLGQHPAATFEEWISELHPENLQADPCTGELTVDPRFYGRHGDHRRLWNTRTSLNRQVPARSSQEAKELRSFPASPCAAALRPHLFRSAYSTPTVGPPHHVFEFFHQPVARTRSPGRASYYHLGHLLRSCELGADQLKVGALRQTSIVRHIWHPAAFHQGSQDVHRTRRRSMPAHVQSGFVSHQLLPGCAHLHQQRHRDCTCVVQHLWQPPALQQGHGPWLRPQLGGTSMTRPSSPLGTSGAVTVAATAMAARAASRITPSAQPVSLRPARTSIGCASLQKVPWVEKPNCVAAFGGA